METFETPQPTQPTEPKTTNWSKIVLVAVLGLGLLAAAAYAGYRYGTESAKVKTQSAKPTPIVSQPTPKPTQTPKPTPTPTPNVTPIKNWGVYSNTDYGFSFNYPTNFSIRQVGWAPYLYGEQSDFYLHLVQDVYKDQAQNPEITVGVVKTTKTTGQYVSEMQNAIAKTNEELQDPNGIYYGADPAEITSNTAVTIDNVPAVRIERFAGPGAPNANYTDYIFNYGNYLYVLSANYGTYNPDVNQDGTVEKNTLDQILSTFKFL